MKLIKCFTDSHLDNLAVCLHLQPEEVVFLGEADQMEKSLPRYKKLLYQKSLSTKVTACKIRSKDVAEIAALLQDLAAERADCAVDITGGAESMVLSVGAVLAARQLQVVQFDYENQTVRDACNGSVIPTPFVGLTVEQLVELHGGVLDKRPYTPPAGTTNRSLDNLWQIVSEAPREWNRTLGLLSEFESRSDTKTCIKVTLQKLRGTIRDYDEKVPDVRALLDKFRRNGIIDVYRSVNVLEYTYRTPLLRECTLKAGNVLEIKTLLEGRAARAGGKPLFSDCCMSVSIDWDGVPHKPEDQIPDTRNEIDVVMMHGLRPLFISCKNGSIGEEELYKLHTVASRFGGEHARKMLIATELNQKSAAANRSFAQRAWDMDIFLETDAAELSPAEWEILFRQAIR